MGKTEHQFAGCASRERCTSGDGNYSNKVVTSFPAHTPTKPSYTTHNDEAHIQCVSYSSSIPDADDSTPSFETNNNITSACLRMPDDILYEILTWYLLKDTPFPPTPSQLFDPALNTITRGASIWRVAQVCTRWRAILLSSPVLWSSIRFSSAHCCLDRFCRAGSPTRLLDLQLKRSGTAPLEICWSASSPCSVSLFRMLLGHSTRWARVSIGRIPSEGVACPTGLRYQLPGLQSLSLSTQFLSRLPSLEDAPNLTSLRIEANSLCLGEPNIFSKLSLKQLKHLSVERPYSSSFLNILSQTPNVETIEVIGGSVLQLAVTPSDLTPLDLPELRRLHIQGLGFQPIFECMNPPRLDTLHVSVGNSPSSACPLLSHCSDYITTLTLDDVRGGEEEDFRSLLRNCPRLLELNVIFSGLVFKQGIDITAFLRSLVCTDGESLCPSLQSLSLLVDIYSLQTPVFDSHLLTQVQLSRKKTHLCQPLARVRLSLNVVAGIFNTCCQLQSYANELMSRGISANHEPCPAEECSSQVVVGGEVRRGGPRHLGTDYIEIPYCPLDRDCKPRREIGL